MFDGRLAPRSRHVGLEPAEARHAAVHNAAGSPRIALRMPRAPRLRAVGIACVVGYVIYSCLRSFETTMPVDTWLAWTLLKVWGWQAVLALTLVVSGQAVVARVLRIRAPSPVAGLTLAVPVGAMAFSTGIFVAGYLGLLNPTFAVMWPLLLTMASLWRLGHHPQDLARIVRGLWPRRPASPVQAVLIACGLLGVGLAYLQILSPQSTTYDASWTHLTIAQDYAREGRIVPFYADWPKNLAHWGSIINTWSYLVPGLDHPAKRTMMALHTEFGFFLWTLIAVAAGIERLGVRARASWAAVFLFPALYYDDHFLGGGADHFLAFFAVPVFWGVLEVTRTRQRRWWAFTAIVAAGAVMTKYQAIIMLAPAIAVLTWVAADDVVTRWRASPRAARPCPWAGPALALGVAAVVTAPHFLANIIWYHNPVYPMAQGIFTGSRPTLPDAPLLADFVLKSWGAHPAKEWLPWLRNLVLAVTTFPCHPKAPESGPMFALAILVSPFLPQGRQIRWALLFCLGALVTWNLTYVQGRNLQGILPLVAMATGAALARAFRVSGTARVAIGAVIAFQIVASIDSAFNDHGRLDRALAMIRASREKHARDWLDGYERDYVALGESLPRNAVLLMHDDHPNLGIDRRVLHDWLGFQSLVDHRTFTQARDLYLAYRALGVTHVFYQPGLHPAETRQSEAVFAAFAMHCRGGFHDFGRLRVFEMPTEPPPQEPPYQVLLLGVGGQDDGLYLVSDLGTSEDLPGEKQARRSPRLAFTLDAQASLVSRAKVLLLGRQASLAPDLLRDFLSFASYDGLSVWVRR